MPTSSNAASQITQLKAMLNTAVDMYQMVLEDTANKIELTEVCECEMEFDNQDQSSAVCYMCGCKKVEV